MSGDSTDAVGMQPLQHLILDQMRRRGWSPKHVEDRGVSHATLHRYMNPVKLDQLPRRNVMESLAAALDLPVERVRAAAVETLEGRLSQPQPAQLSVVPSIVDASLEDEEDNKVLAAIREDPHLSPASKAHFLNQYVLLRELSDRQAAAAEGNEPLPYVAHGQRTTDVDPEEEKRLEEIARRAARRNDPTLPPE